MEIGLTNNKIETTLMQLKLLGAEVVEFDLKNGFVSGYKLVISGGSYFLIRYPFGQTYIYACLLKERFNGTRLPMIALFSKTHPIKEEFQTEITMLEKLPKLSQTILNNYNKRAVSAFKKFKEAFNGAKDNI